METRGQTMKKEDMLAELLESLRVQREEQKELHQVLTDQLQRQEEKQDRTQQELKEQQERTQQVLAEQLQRQEEKQEKAQQELWAKLQERQEEQQKQIEERFAELQEQLQSVREESESWRRGLVDATISLDQRQTRMKEEQARLRQQQEAVQEAVHREVMKLDDKVRRAEEEVSDIDNRVKAIENCLAGNKHTLSLGVSYVQDKCAECSSDILSPSAPEFTPVRSAARDMGYMGLPLRKKPQEFDCRVSWEAYRAQFELLAGQNGWDDQQCAVQLATSLKGAALEVLAQLDNAERRSYLRMAQALGRRYGTKHQDEVFRTRFRTRTWRRGESLQELAQDLENMAHKAYPGANPDLLTVLLRDQFVDALESPQLKIQVKQAKPATLQEALTSALEFESLVKSSLSSFRDDSSSGFKARRGFIRDVSKFRGACWYCEKVGHKKNECYQVQQVLDLWREGTPAEGMSTANRVGWCREETSSLSCTCTKDDIMQKDYHNKLSGGWRGRRSGVASGRRHRVRVDLGTARYCQSSAASRDVTPVERGHWTLYGAQGSSGCQVLAWREGGVPHCVRG